MYAYVLLLSPVCHNIVVCMYVYLSESMVRGGKKKRKSKEKLSNICQYYLYILNKFEGGEVDKVKFYKN